MEKYYNSKKTYKYTLVRDSKSKVFVFNIYNSTVQRDLLKQYLLQGWTIKEAKEVL